MRQKVQLALVALTALCLVGGKCGGGSGGGGGGSVRIIDSPDARCAALSSNFPAGFDFVPGAPDDVWVTDLAPPNIVLVPFDVMRVPPRLRTPPGQLLLPFDTDGDGRPEPDFSRQPFIASAPILDDIELVSADLGLVTASGYEEVIFFSPATGALRSFDVSVPAGASASDNPFLPAPNAPAQARTGVSTFACVRPPLGALDSRGDPIATSVPQAGFCDPDPSYYATFTAGAAIAASRLFVATSNVGNDPGMADTQYLPGSVLVYDIDLTANPPTLFPNAATPVILTQGFNPTHVTAYRVGLREFILVTVSGAIGLSGVDTLVLTPSAIEVIDAHTLQLVATIPLGNAGLTDGKLAIDASGRVAVVGSVTARELLAVDLMPVAGLPGMSVPPLVLDGSTGPDAVIFDAAAPFDIPARAGGAPAASCPGRTEGVAFDGSRLYATENCDGTLAVVDVDVTGNPPAPLAPGRFQLLQVVNITAPTRPDTLDQVRSPGDVAARPAVSATDPNVFFLVGISGQEGLLCAIRVD